MTYKTKVWIVEDDADTSDYLSGILIDKVKNVQILGTSSSVKESIKSIKQQKPELVLMDIILTDGNAFSILDDFKDPWFEVIFISAHGKYMERALEYYAFNFLTKPIDAKALVQLFKRYDNFKQRVFELNKYHMLKEILLESGKKFLLHVGNKHIAIDFSEIIRCRAEGNYTHFILSDKRKFLVSNPLGYYSDLLEKKHFFRTSRFDLINLHHIDHIYKKETVVLSNNEKVSISTRNRAKLALLIKDLSL